LGAVISRHRVESAASSENCRRANSVVECDQVYQSVGMMDGDAAHRTTLINYCFIDHVAPMTIDFQPAIHTSGADR